MLFRSIIETSCDYVLISSTIYNPKTDIKVMNNKQINISIKLNAKLDSDTFKDYDSLENIKKSLEKDIKENINSLLNISYIQDIDLLGIKDKLYKYHPNLYKNYHDKNIYEIFSFNIKINANIKAND